MSFGWKGSAFIGTPAEAWTMIIPSIICDEMEDMSTFLVDVKSSKKNVKGRNGVESNEQMNAIWGANS
eukprot:12320439-Prorocentrum_lima.AAC.1